MLSEIGDVSVAVRLSGAANYSIFAAARYEEPIDFEKWLMDYYADTLCMYNYTLIDLAKIKFDFKIKNSV